MQLGLILFLLHIDCSGDPIERDHVSEWRSVAILQFSLAANLHLLRRISIAVHDGARRLLGPLVQRHLDVTIEPEAGNRLGFVHQFLLGGCHQLEVLPPARLVLAPVEVEQIGGSTARGRPCPVVERRRYH